MPGETLDQLFLVREKDMRTTKSGDLYLVCTLTDRTGALPARMWNISEAIFNSVPVDGFIHVKGRTEDYRGTLQCVIDACRPWATEKVELADFLPVTELDVEEMWAELCELLRGLKDKWVRLLVKKFMEDREFVAAFKRAPASMQLHHPYIGGLLEHTLGVMKSAAAVLPLYPKLSADLILAGSFLHDIGKTVELAASTSMTYTDRGLLVGHITIGAVMLAEKAKLLSQELNEPFAPRTLDLLQHIVLSHHGTMEFGSPRLPCVPEAFVVHYLDNLDAKIWMTQHCISNDPDPKSAFTAYNRALETRLYKPGLAAE